MFQVTAAWFVACTLIHVVGLQVLKPSLFPILKRFEKPQRDLRELPNIVVAALHASIMFAGNLRYMLPKLDVARAGPLLFRVDRIRPNHPAEEFWIEMMLGYIVYDTCAGFFTGANGTDIILHHLLGGISWASLLLTRTGGIFAMWIHLAEGSTPFLHLSTTLFKLKLSHTPLFKASSALLLLLFTLLRVYVAPLCAVVLWRTRSDWGRPLRPLFYINFAITIFFLGLNFLWWAKLMQRALGAGGGKKGKGAGGKPRARPDGEGAGAVGLAPGGAAAASAGSSKRDF